MYEKQLTTGPNIVQNGMYLIISLLSWITKMAEGFYGTMREVLLFEPSANLNFPEEKSITGDAFMDETICSGRNKEDLSGTKAFCSHVLLNKASQDEQVPGQKLDIRAKNGTSSVGLPYAIAEDRILKKCQCSAIHPFEVPVSRVAQNQRDVAYIRQILHMTHSNQSPKASSRMGGRYGVKGDILQNSEEEREYDSKLQHKVFHLPPASKAHCINFCTEMCSVDVLNNPKNRVAQRSGVATSENQTINQSDYPEVSSFSSLEVGRTYRVIVCSSIVGHHSKTYIIEDDEPAIQVDTSKLQIRNLYSMFKMQMPIYISNSESESLWRSTKRIIKHFVMVRGKNKAKRKKVFTETQTDFKNSNEITAETVFGDGKSLITGRNVEEIFHEAHSIIEGPAEIPLMQPPTYANAKRNQSQSREVDTDGSISDFPTDPPGQQTLYIVPGDNRREAYRLSTFEHFPNKAIQTALLAKNGFSYTGYFDRVKCFSCGRAVESWEPRDNPADRKWHKGDCSFMLGHSSGNVPLGGGLLGGFHSSLLNPSTSQQTNQTANFSAQNIGTASVQMPNDFTDLQRGGSFQLQPGQGMVIGPGSQPPSYQTTTTNNPPARNPPRQWRMANVISSDHKRHLTNLYLNRELDRLASFGRWPTGRPNVSPVSLAGAGFFYLGDMDRTQCFSCGGVLRNWSAADIAMEEHRTHFPNCRFVVGVERRNVPVSGQPESSQELAQKYPCRFPMNPHMRSEPSRVQTFDRRWPVGRTRAQPQEIAEAGFFFLGDRDRVKCWYCNGGLQNWEYDDIPWVEHAKWFPNCQFLLAKKGQKFVHDHLSLCPHLPRPIISRQDGAAVDTSTATPHSSTPEERPSSFGQDVPPPGARVRVPTPPPAIIDPQMEQRKRMERIDKEMNESETVKFVKAMGYEESLIRKSLLEKLESGTRYDAENIFDGNAALLDAVMKKEEEVKKEEEEQRNAAAAAPVPPIPPPVHGISFPSISSNYSSFQQESMDTSASLEPISGVHIVSGFDSDDEDIDLYGGSSSRNLQSQPIGAVGGVSLAPSSTGGETSIQSHLWDDVPSDPESMKEFIEQKKEERLCKICFTETADMVFIPCSHMVCCMTCTQALRNCPVCRKKIEKAIKTYSK